MSSAVSRTQLRGQTRGKIDVALVLGGIAPAMAVIEANPETSRRGDPFDDYPIFRC